MTFEFNSRVGILRGFYHGCIGNIIYHIFLPETLSRFQNVYDVRLTEDRYGRKINEVARVNGADLELLEE